jgi:integrase
MYDSSFKNGKRGGDGTIAGRGLHIRSLCLTLVLRMPRFIVLTCGLGHRHVFVYHRSPVREVRTAFRTACKRAGIENLRFHDLRQCAATNLRRAGVNTTTAMQIIGDKSPYMWKRCNTVADSDLVAAANKLHTYLSNTVITPTDSEKTVQVISD